MQQSTYFLVCLRYIELNPVRAGMAEDPADYHWSSYHANGFGRASKLWTPHPLCLGLGNTDSERQARYRSLFESHMEGELLSEVRQSVNRGLALGSEQFRQELEALGGRRQRLHERGPRSRVEG